MGFLGSLFGKSTSDDGDEYGTCASCDWPLTAADEDGEFCNDCVSEGGSAKYCCGAIYEYGEDTCASCGDPL